MTEDTNAQKPTFVGFKWTVGVLGILAVGFVLLAPIVLTPKFGCRENPFMQQTRSINLILHLYASDHGGVYPTGKTSTEVFQKLVDEKYVNELSVFYVEGLHIPGKKKPDSGRLLPENVCYDLTVPLDGNSPEGVPVVFVTGFRIDYVPGGGATPLFKPSGNRPSVFAVGYKTDSNSYLKGRESDGLVDKVISLQFDTGGNKFQQLTPDGVLGP